MARRTLPASCAPDEQGTNGEFESFLDFGGPNRPSDMHGWPTFRDWPSPTTLSEEGDYYTGIEGAWKAGLRVMVTQLVDNEALCSMMTKRHNPCNDMAAVRLQSQDLYALQNYIDAQPVTGRRRAASGRWGRGHRGGRIVFVAITAASQLHRAALLRADLQAAGL